MALIKKLSKVNGISYTKSGGKWVLTGQLELDYGSYVQKQKEMNFHFVCFEDFIQGKVF